jgi:hypothetical protein
MDNSVVVKTLKLREKGWIYIALNLGYLEILKLLSFVLSFVNFSTLPTSHDRYAAAFFTRIYTDQVGT